MGFNTGKVMSWEDYAEQMENKQNVKQQPENVIKESATDVNKKDSETPKAEAAKEA